MIKRGLALLMVLVMCLSFLPALHINVNAASNTVDYVYNGKYIYNWGKRGTVATFLSPNAEKFYAENGSYESIIANAGGTSVSNAPTSALYSVLKNIMVSNHSYQTSYDATKNLFQYTDCQNSGGQISSFYSGTGIGPSWNGGWNREHTWPNSKGLNGNDENDIMMLRPTSTSENSSRGNTAYGQSSGYYNPNSESGGKYDLRGDVARIFLYVYVRWGNVNGNGSYSTWGTRGVFESVDVLLAWMEADPVDTWELGRNDSVESITGTRNVFVDYPELAFLLFGEEIPDNMKTPSGASAQGCNHNNYNAGVVVKPTCTEGGYTIYTCLTAGCNQTKKTNLVDPTGHTFSAGACTVCGTAANPATCTHNYADNVCTLCGNVKGCDHTYQNGVCTICGSIQPSSSSANISFASTANRTEFSTTIQVWKQNGITVTNNKAGASSSVADYVNPVRFYQGSSVTIEYPNMTKIEINCKDLEAKYVNSWKSVPAGATATESNGVVTITFSSPVNSIVFSSLASQSRAYDITVYSEGAAAEECKHTSTTVKDAVAATCTSNGFSGKTYCNNCGALVSVGVTTPKTEHAFESWTTSTPATCTTAGIGRRDCKNCDYYETEALAALGHTDANDDDICDICGEPSDSQPTHTEHEYGEWITTTEPTCASNGSERRTCAVCGEFETRELEMLSHYDINGDDLCELCGCTMTYNTTSGCQSIIGGASFCMIAVISTAAIMVAKKKED